MTPAANQQAVKRWRFRVEDIDGNGDTVDRQGGPDGDSTDEEFIGTSREASDEADRRANLWEQRTGRIAHKVVRESHGTADTSQQPASAPTAPMSPLQTVDYWRQAYSSSASGPHFMGHGMVVKLLGEYAALRRSLEDTGAAPAARLQLPDQGRAGLEALHRLFEQLATRGAATDPDGKLSLALGELLACIAEPPFRLAGDITLRPVCVEGEDGTCQNPGHHHWDCGLAWKLRVVDAELCSEGDKAKNCIADYNGILARCESEDDARYFVAVALAHARAIDLLRRLRERAPDHWQDAAGFRDLWEEIDRQVDGPKAAAAPRRGSREQG